MILRSLPTLFFLVFFICDIGAQAPEGFEVMLLAEGLDPVTMAETPDGRILVAEKKEPSGL